MRVRGLGLVSLVCAAAIGAGQAADFVLLADLRPTVNSGVDGNEFRWFDHNAQSSVIGIRLLLVDGSRVKFTQRLTHLPGDGDPGYVDEAYIERRGLWRVGKQWLPFGRQMLVRESITGVRFDTTLVFGNEASVVAFDNGEGRSRGVGFRAGSSLGFSVLSGNHLAIGPATLTEIEGIRGGMGRGGGYRLLVSGDAAFRWGGHQWQAEHVVFLDPERANDRSFAASQVGFTIGPPVSNWAISLTWAKRWDQDSDHVGLAIEAPSEGPVTYRGYLTLEGGVTFRGGFGMTFRF